MKEDKTLTEEIEKIYTERTNYYEEYPHLQGKHCYIFFSSNGLYGQESFQETMLKKDRYEWRSMAKAFKYHRDLGKIIYVRDVFKSFYIYGINQELDSIDKVIERLKILTDGYEITTVGISSGGYMAVISAILLNAKRAFCISGQFNIEGHLEQEDLNYCSFSEEKRKYINISGLIQSNRNVPIFYFCPIGCRHDYENYQIVKEVDNVKCFLFPDKKHAATVYPFNFPDLLFLSNERLNKICSHYAGRIINKQFFYFRTVSIRGICTLLAYIWKSKLKIDSLIKKWDV